jgi:hypothetical protein
MNEQIPQDSQPMAPPEHGDYISVYGRDEVLAYEESIASQETTEEETLQESIQDARQVMAAFSGDEYLDSTTNSFFDSKTTMPDIFLLGKRAAELETGRPLSWTEWLAHKADDRQLLNFLQWHTFEHENRGNSPEHAQEVARQKSEFAGRVQLLKDAGILHEGSLPDAAALERVKIVTKDIFHSHMFGDGHASDPETGAIELVEGYKPVVMWHELSHSVLGRLSEDGFDPKQWLNEAVTEHIAQVLDKGNPEEVHPDSRGDDGAYIVERKILAAILNGGLVRISPNHLTRLYSAPTEEARKIAEDELRQQFMRAYNDPNILEKATAYIETFAPNGTPIHDGSQLRAADALIANPSILLESRS